MVVSVIDEVKNKVLVLCAEDHKTKIWHSHITKVVYYSKLLAEKLGASIEVCELASWLHDISKMEGVKKEHHIKGAERAGEILRGLNYNEDKIKKVQDAIIAHSSDDRHPPISLEQKIVACADALAWLDDFLLFVHGLLYIKKIPSDDVKIILKDKLLVAKTKVSVISEAQLMAEPKILAAEFLLEV